MKKLLLTDHSFILDLFFASNGEDFNYFYRGEINYDLSSYILSLAENNLKKTKLKSRTKKRIFHIMVESLQNISKHQYVSAKDWAKISFFGIQKKDFIYFITTGNIVHNEHVENLKQKLDDLNNMSAQDLTNFYKEVLGNGIFSPKGGAGLGLIEIARKSGNKLKYDFKKINDELSFFYLQTYVKTKEEEIYYLPSIYDFEYLKKLHGQLIDQNIFLIYASIFEQKSLISLISLLKSQFHQNIKFGKRVVSAIIELLQNIIKHAKIEYKNLKGALGLFYISNDKEYLYLNTINYVYNDKVKKFIDKINEVNNMKPKELETYYNQKLFDLDSPDTGGLGFIEIRMKSKRRIYYDVVKLDEKISLLALQVSFKFE